MLIGLNLFNGRYNQMDPLFCLFRFDNLLFSLDFQFPRIAFSLSGSTLIFSFIFFLFIIYLFYFFCGGGGGGWNAQKCLLGT